MTQRVWLFDLDNTLHDASHAIFPAISANMNVYLARILGQNGVPATPSFGSAENFCIKNSM